jgi:hypothetical protein
VRRLPLTLRAMLLVPLLAVTVDHVRAAVVCGPDGQSCIETAGQGALGAAGSVVLILYAVALAFGVARLLVPRAGPLRRWVVGAAGVAAVCGGQALLAGALADAGALGGGWAELLALCGAAGGLLALALRAAPAAAALVRSLRPSAPRLRSIEIIAAGAPAPVALRLAAPLATAAAGRAPPLTRR